MKLFNAIAAVAVIGASFIAPNPAEAQTAPNGWAVVGTTDRGVTMYIKSLGCNGNYCTYLDKDTQDGTLKAEVDCRNWRSRWVNDDGTKDPWRDVMPDSWGAKKLRFAC